MVHLVKKKKSSSNLQRNVRKEKTTSLCFLLCILLLFCSLEYKHPQGLVTFYLTLRQSPFISTHRGIQPHQGGNDSEGRNALNKLIHHILNLQECILLSVGTICAYFVFKHVVLIVIKIVYLDDLRNI